MLGVRQHDKEKPKHSNPSEPNQAEAGAVVTAGTESVWVDL